MKKKISIIASFHNEEENINEFTSRINNSFKKFKGENLITVERNGLILSTLRKKL